MPAPAIPAAEPHVRALQAALVAEIPASIGVGVGKAPDRSPPVIAIYPDSGDVQAARLDGQRQHIVIYFAVHAIGSGPEQASWTSDHARTALLGTPPVVAGRKVHRLTQTMAPPPMTRDDDVSPPLFLQVCEYRLVSEPA